MEPDQTPQLFQPYLLAGERVLWSGQPKQGLTLSGRDPHMIPFSLMWGGFAILWNASVWFAPFDSGSDGDPIWFFKLLGLPFLFGGLYLIVGRFFHDAYLRKRLFYAVTDHRILTLRARNFLSLDIRKLRRLELSEHRDKTGTLAFEANSPMALGRMNGIGLWLPSAGGNSQFFCIQDPRKVYEIIRNQAHA